MLSFNTGSLVKVTVICQSPGVYGQACYNIYIQAKMADMSLNGWVTEALLSVLGER